VYRLATMQDRAMSTTVLLLAGVTLNSFFSALIMFVQYIADFAQVYRAVRWIMGDLDVGSFEPIMAALPMLAIAFAMFAWLPSSLNLLSVGADAASCSRRRCWSNAAARIRQRVTRHCGLPYRSPDQSAFIGIVVPHLVRLIVGVDHRLVLPRRRCLAQRSRRVRSGRAHAAGAFEIPVGVITATAGRAVLLWLTGPKRLIGLAFVAVIVFWATAPATTQPRPAAAQRIVSLVPALTEMLFAIGAGPQVVAVSSYDEFPPEVKSLPKSARCSIQTWNESSRCVRISS
jgi:hypothetical protein